MPEASSDNREDMPAVESRRLTRLYVFALSTVAILSIGAQLLVQRGFHTGKDDSHVINIAGRQRMLSQRLAKASLRFNYRQDSEAKSELIDTLATWKKNHYGLQQGDEEIGLPGAISAEVEDLFSSIEPHFIAMRKGAEFLSRDTVEAEQADLAVEAIQQNEPRFLNGMDKIVSQFVAEAEARVRSLRRLEYIILWLTLGVLTAEGLLIFRPAVRHIELFSKGLNQAKEEAENANAAKTRFLANVSHELRTPMTAVLGMTELARSSKLEEERDGYLQTVQEAGSSLMILLNDLIDIARIDANQIDLVDLPFEPVEVIKRVGRMMQPTADSKSLELVIEQPSHDLPILLGDSRRLEQVMLNFVANAIKSTNKGSVTLRVEQIDCQTEKLTCRYSVIDTGIGIKKEDQQRIFEPFSQVVIDNSLPLSGTGLGLSICRRICDAIGGKIELDSTPGEGTCISMLCQHPFASPEQKIETQYETVSLKEKLKVLVVEDTEVNQILLRKLLESDGHEVVTAINGESALPIYDNNNIDLVLIDLSLPGMDGQEVSKQIRRNDALRKHKTPPLLCITAHVNFEESKLEECFDAVITKPIERGSFFNTISEQIGRQHERVSTNVSSEQIDNDLANAFLAIAESQLNELDQATSSKELKKIRLLSHRFRSQIGYFYAEDLVNEFEEIEAACLDENLERVDLLVAKAMSSTQRFLTRLKTQVAHN